MLVRQQSSDKTLMRLVWVPSAGGAASSFSKLSCCMPPGLDALAFEYPGRGRRTHEAAVGSVERLGRELAQACLHLVDKPYAIFGHSMGSLVAFEACRLLRAAEKPLPRVLVASAHRAPQLPLDRAPLSDLSDRELLEELRALGGMPDELLYNSEFITWILPTIRADLTAAETYVPSALERIDVDLVCYTGLSDESVPSASVDGWAAASNRPLRRRSFRGGHFYLFDRPKEVVEALTADLAGVLREAGLRACR